VRPEVPPRPDPEPQTRRRWLLWTAIAVVIGLVAVTGTIVATSDGRPPDEASEALASPSPSPTSLSSGSPATDEDPVFEQAQAGWSAFVVFRMTPDLVGSLAPCQIHTFDGVGAYATGCVFAKRLVLFNVAVRSLRSGKQVLPRSRFAYTDDRGRTYSPFDAGEILVKRYLLHAKITVRDEHWVSGWLAFRVGDPASIGVSLSYGDQATVWFQGEHAVKSV
jgi:hypothetical protein